jgi:hypothetical protein
MLAFPPLTIQATDLAHSSVEGRKKLPEFSKSHKASLTVIFFKYFISSSFHSQLFKSSASPLFLNKLKEKLFCN